MSVSQTTQILRRSWRGYDEPSYPVGVYIAQGVSVGDATAGQNSIVFVFKASNAPPDGMFYNVEQVNAFATAAAVENISMQANRFDQLGPFTLSIRRWRFELQGDGDGHAAIKYNEGFPPRPLFLGQSSRIQGNNTTLAFEVTNVDTVVFQVIAQGYIWSARSIMAQGGLRRPADNLYGQ